MTDAGVIATRPAATVDSITAGAGTYSSLRTNTTDEKRKFLTLVNNAESLNDAATDAGKAGVPLKIKDIVLQEVQIQNETTGVIEDGIRATLVTEDGKAYYATSKGLVQSLKQALAPNMFGTPDTWDEPLEVTAVREKGRNGYFFLTLKYV